MTVPGPKPANPLHGMFTAVPPRYDLINTIITLGLDRGWRKAAARECLNGRPRRVLDLACGTGKLLAELARVGGNIELAGLDYSEPMLDIARRRTNGGNTALFHADAAAMPFPAEHFDCVGISFAFRNLTYRNPVAGRCLAEVLRVLKPGGRFIIVESSQPASGFIRACYHFYMRSFACRVGCRLSGNRGAYRYLAESAAGFFTPREVAGLLRDTGFRDVSYRPLLWGAAGIHVAVK
ncbi:MAG: ubiquinone/menaquinone biosynthesis methyltransferase [Chloroflexi bacterium]|nr:ubiquinone/menaquinone biosynthesis methyltransferase [Chloroflexota bacterium]